MKSLIIFCLFLLSSCTGYTVATLTSNIITFSATGKTNSDHVESLFTGKDCKILRALKEEKYCEEKKLFIAKNKEMGDSVSTEENLKIALLENKIPNDAVSNDEIVIANFEKKEDQGKLVYAQIIIEKFYFGSLTWAEQQIIQGALITDYIGLTDGLSSKVKQSFENYFY